MRIVLLNQFYPPDPAPTGRYLHDLGRALAERGHEVHAFASQHGYAGGESFASREHLDGVRVQRLGGFAFGRATYAGKLADYAGYAAQLAPRLAAMRADVIVALTSPPFLGLLAAAAARLQRARIVHWVMDVYPDVMQAHGMVNGVPLAALEATTRTMYRADDDVVAIGAAMQTRLARYVRGRMHAIPLWTLSGLRPWPSGVRVPLRETRGWEADRMVLMYSGNIGLGHRCDDMLAAAARLGRAGPRWVFAGQGRGRPAVEAFAAEHRALPFEVLDVVPDDRVQEHLCSADVHLASVDPAWDGSIVPSKLQAAFAVGKPVIHVGESDGDLGQWVRASGGGWVVPAGDVAALVQAVAEASQPGEAARRGAAGHAWAAEHFHVRHTLQRLVAVVEGSDPRWTG